MKEFFKNLPDESTPFEADRFNSLFDGKESLGSIVVDDIRSNNLYNYATSILGYAVDTTGTLVESEIACASDYIDVEGISDLIVSNSTIDFRSGCCFYTSDKTFISGFSADQMRAGISVPSNAKYIRINSFIIDREKVKLEPGIIATPFTLYKNFGYNSQESMGKIVVDDIECKNKINADAPTVCTATSWGGNGTKYYFTASSAWQKVEWQIEAKKGEEYTFSYKERNSNALYLYIYEYDLSGNKLRTIVGDNTALTNSFTIENDCILSIMLQNNAVISNIAIEEIQLEKGLEKTTFTSFKNFDGKINYSTKEQEIGTWIDGKKVYRKVISCGALPNVGYKTIAHNVSIDNLVKIDCIAKRQSDNTFRHLNTFTYDGTAFISVWIEATNIVFYSTTDYSAYTNTYVILEYTKS